MVKGAGPSMVKTILLFLNFIYLVAGVTCVVLGFLALLDKSHLNALLDLENSQTTLGMMTGSAVVIVIVGWATIIFSILGCCGAGRESKVLLGVYIGFLIILLIVQLIGGALAASYRTENEEEMRTWMVEQVKTNYDGRGDTKIQFAKSLDFAQVEFECCGINNYSDFKDLALNWTERDSRTVPIACCKLNKTEFYSRNVFIVNNRSCTTAPTSDITNIDEPCFEKIRDHLMTQALYLILIAFLLIVVELMGVVFACILMRTIKDNVV